jgi:hypothetical protein
LYWHDRSLLSWGPPAPPGSGHRGLAARIVARHAKKNPDLFTGKAVDDAKKRGFDPDKPEVISTKSREHAPDEEDVSVDHQALIDGYLAKAQEKPHGANSVGQKLTDRERRQAETRALAGGRPQNRITR